MHSPFDIDVRVLGVLLLIFLSGLFPFLVWYARQSRKRNRIILRKWAEQQELQTIRISRRWLHPWFSSSPFVEEAGFEESIYRIEVLDKAKRRKKGWVACGCGDVSVRWDE
jgi:hypothetical protein